MEVNPNIDELQAFIASEAILSMVEDHKFIIKKVKPRRFFNFNLQRFEYEWMEGSSHFCDRIFGHDYGCGTYLQN